MRKIKKINGYLVVRFNDREKRLYEGAIGSFGVIDAELYTGDLDLDRAAMEYDNAETQAEAEELARGLESEADIDDTGERFVLVTEGADSFTEDEINPQLMISGFERMLERRIGSEKHPEVDALMAAHELRGFKAALDRLGLIDGAEAEVLEDHFGEVKQPLPRGPEDLLCYVCDSVCKHRCGDRETQDAICAECALNRLYEEAEGAELNRRQMTLARMNQLRRQTAQPQQVKLQAEIHGSNARWYIQALEDTGFIGTAEADGYREQIQTALEVQPKRDSFLSLPPGLQVHGQKLWDLGMQLMEKCPENDCTIYRNIFAQVRELDSQRGILGGYAALVLEREQNRMIRELEQMYLMSSAVRCFRAEHPGWTEERDAPKETPAAGTWVTRFVSHMGVSFNGEVWTSRALELHAGERVEVRRTENGVAARIPGGEEIGPLHRLAGSKKEPPVGQTAPGSDCPVRGRGQQVDKLCGLIDELEEYGGA